jgi:hypothetical protein
MIREMFGAFIDPFPQLLLAPFAALHCSPDHR